MGLLLIDPWEWQAAWQGFRLKSWFAQYSQYLAEVTAEEAVGSRIGVKTVALEIFQQKECVSKLILFPLNM